MPSFLARLKASSKTPRRVPVSDTSDSFRAPWMVDTRRTLIPRRFSAWKSRSIRALSRDATLAPPTMPPTVL